MTKPLSYLSSERGRKSKGRGVDHGEGESSQSNARSTLAGEKRKSNHTILGGETRRTFVGIGLTKIKTSQTKKPESINLRERIFVSGPSEKKKGAEFFSKKHRENSFLTHQRTRGYGRRL